MVSYRLEPSIGDGTGGIGGNGPNSGLCPHGCLGLGGAHTGAYGSGAGHGGGGSHGLQGIVGLSGIYGIIIGSFHIVVAL